MLSLSLLTGHCAAYETAITLSYWAAFDHGSARDPLAISRLHFAPDSQNSHEHLSRCQPSIFCFRVNDPLAHRRAHPTMTSLNSSSSDETILSPYTKDLFYSQWPIQPGSTAGTRRIHKRRLYRSSEEEPQTFPQTLCRHFKHGLRLNSFVVKCYMDLTEALATSDTESFAYHERTTEHLECAGRTCHQSLLPVISLIIRACQRCTCRQLETSTNGLVGYSRKARLRTSSATGSNSPYRIFVSTYIRLFVAGERVASHKGDGALLDFLFLDDSSVWQEASAR